ncbi:TnsA endonuclease N-terminal domain-containing protein [Pseudomonas sp. LFM046]|uniref:TnsA endonuclease N-terminal domain-containing protein n=1 Tax=Pseudomonas sp. LFM046 TaxID=1608357 RepID=UPI000AA6DF98|nr:TnsA endonuclease N-terminal domain-containing protein [Pseudomonas sp. LFM046]
MKKIRSSSGGTLPPERSIGRSKYGKQTTVFPSRKNGSLIICETRLEADACFHWEQDRNVIAYREQPERLHLVVEGKARTYVPDFVVQYADRPIRFVEVKPDNVYQKPKYLALYRAAKQLLKTRGADFELLTERKIRRQPLLNNLIRTYNQSRGVLPLELDFLRDQLAAPQANPQ